MKYKVGDLFVNNEGHNKREYYFKIIKLSLEEEEAIVHYELCGKNGEYEEFGVPYRQTESMLTSRLEKGRCRYVTNISTPTYPFFINIRGKFLL
jgi:hypothetical protein